MSLQHPLVRIEYTRLLDPYFKELFELKGGIKDETEYPSLEVINGRVQNFLTAWEPYEERVLNGLVEVTGLHFFQNTIDAYIIGRARGAFSFPMVLSSHYEPDRFIDILTHEMTHRLLTDNTENGCHANCCKLNSRTRYY